MAAGEGEPDAGRSPRHSREGGNPAREAPLSTSPPRRGQRAIARRVRVNRWGGGGACHAEQSQRSRGISRVAPAHGEPVESPSFPRRQEPRSHLSARLASTTTETAHAHPSVSASLISRASLIKSAELPRRGLPPNISRRSSANSSSSGLSGNGFSISYVLHPYSRYDVSFRSSTRSSHSHSIEPCIWPRSPAVFSMAGSGAW